MEFEWDDEKRTASIAKHGIDFLDACRAWEKPIIDPADERFQDDEYRPTALGVIGDDEIIIAISLYGSSERFAHNQRKKGKAQ